MQTFCLLRWLQILLLWQANRCRPLACSRPAWLRGSSPVSAAGSPLSSSSNWEKGCPPEKGLEANGSCVLSPCSPCRSHVRLLGHTQLANALKVASVLGLCALPSEVAQWPGIPSPGWCETVGGSHIHHIAVVGPPGLLRFTVGWSPKAHIRRFWDVGSWETLAFWAS